MLTSSVLAVVVVVVMVVVVRGILEWFGGGYWLFIDDMGF